MTYFFAIFAAMSLVAGLVSVKGLFDCLGESIGRYVGFFLLATANFAFVLVNLMSMYTHI